MSGALSYYYCVIKGWAGTESEGGWNSGQLAASMLDGCLSVTGCSGHPGNYLSKPPAISFKPLTAELLERRSLERIEFDITLADYDLGTVAYLLGRDAFEFSDEYVVDRPITSINSNWRWDREGLAFRIWGNCGFPKPRVPELIGHKRGNSYEIEAQAPWPSLPELFAPDFVEIMKSRAGRA